MRSIPSKNTKPEMIIDKILTELDVAHIKHCNRLYGKPDFLCGQYKAVILVNGCFWHGHQCHMFRAPDPTSKYWMNKLKKNMERDICVISNANDLGYKVLVIWECALLGKKQLDPFVLQDSVEEWLLAGTGNCEIDYQGIKALILPTNLSQHQV